MNSRIRRLGIALMACYLVLFVKLNYLQVVKADSYNNDPANTRKVVRDFASPRGSIFSADGVSVAQSVPSNDRFKLQRTYPTKDLFAGITGYFSFTYGTEGVEHTYNDLLAGQTDAQKVHSITDLFRDETRTADVTLTIRSDVQQVAKDALGQRPGAVAAIDPRTGAVLALWSYPSYDPNVLANHDAAAAKAARDQLLAAPGSPLLASSYRQVFFPGSTFKLVTGSTGVESGQVTTSQPNYPPSAEYLPPLTTTPIKNFGGETCGGALVDILVVSCNVAFAQMGVMLGPQTMVKGAESFGFNDAPPIDLFPAAAKSKFPPVSFFEHNTPLLAQSAIGQNEVQASPLEMALIAASLVNKGTMMAPYVVDHVTGTDGQTLYQAAPHLWKQAVSESTAATMRDAMVEVVKRGTATGLQMPNVVLAGKTGTAQLGTNPPSSHAWVVGAGPVDAPRVAVAVIVEGQPGLSEVTGGRVAAPIARAVIAKVLSLPDPVTGAPSK